MRSFTFAVVLLGALAGRCHGQPTLGSPQPTLLSPQFGTPQAVATPTTSTRTTYQSARSYVEATGPDAEFFHFDAHPGQAAPTSERVAETAVLRGGGLPTMWLRAEYLYWWTRGATLPQLVTTGPAGVLPSLDQPSAVVLLGGRSSMLQQSGARFTFGMSLEDEKQDGDPPSGPRSVGMEMTYFFLTPRGQSFGASSGGDPLLARPFTDIASGTPTPSAQLVANATIPDTPALAGAIVASSRTRLWGVEGNMIFTLVRDQDQLGSRNCCFLMGYRHLSLGDDLAVTEQFQQPVGALSTMLVQDRFSTRNTFNGMQLGLRGESQFYGAWFVQVSGKIAMGTLQEQVDIRGFTQDRSAAGVTTVNGGLLAQASNIGRYSRDRFAVLPEGEAKLGYWLTRTMKAHVGYNVLFLSRAVRAGDQVDLTVNSNQVPLYTGGVPQAATGDAARPGFSFHDTAFWAHGVTFGVEFNW